MLLQDLHVLVTRPRPQGEILCQKIQALGGNPVYLPTIEIVCPPDIALFKQQIRELEQYDWLIFISPQAVIQSAPIIHALWSLWPNQVKVAAMGAGTAQALKENNLPVTIFPENDSRSEGLLNLPEFQQVLNKEIAIISGVGGRRLLAETLSQRGAKVKSLIAYQRILPQLNVARYAHLFRAHLIDIIVCASNESLQNLVALMTKESEADLLTVPVIVVSERMAGQARLCGFTKIKVAVNASHECILAVIKSIRKNENGK